MLYASFAAVIVILCLFSEINIIAILGSFGDDDNMIMLKTSENYIQGDESRAIRRVSGMASGWNQ